MFGWTFFCIFEPHHPTDVPTMAFLKKIFFKSRHLILYGSILAILVFALKWMQWKFLIVDNSLDIYIGLIAVFFTILGVWVATQLVKPKLASGTIATSTLME